MNGTAVRLVRTVLALDTAPVLADDACPLCGYWRCRCGEAVTFDTTVGQLALADIIADLEHDAVSDVDHEDLVHYRSLLGARIVGLPRQAMTHFERGVAA